jgi:hypothetical protein
MRRPATLWRATAQYQAAADSLSRALEPCLSISDLWEAGGLLNDMGEVSLMTSQREGNDDRGHSEPEPRESGADPYPAGAAIDAVALRHRVPHHLGPVPSRVRAAQCQPGLGRPMMGGRS